MIFEDQTNDDVFKHPLTQSRLEFDEVRREYRVAQPGLAERFSNPFRPWFSRLPGDVAPVRVTEPTALVVGQAIRGGERLPICLGVGRTRETTCGAFCLFCVVFSADRRFALVFIRYAVTCSYYLVFERFPAQWECAEFCMGWITCPVVKPNHLLPSLSPEVPTDFFAALALCSGFCPMAPKEHHWRVKNQGDHSTQSGRSGDTCTEQAGQPRMNSAR